MRKFFLAYCPRNTAVDERVATAIRVVNTPTANPTTMAQKMVFFALATFAIVFYGYFLFFKK